MNKPRFRFLFLLLLGSVLLCNCEKLGIPNDEEEAATADNSNDNTNNESGASASDIQAFSVDDIINNRYSQTTDVYMEGYIVGYVGKSNNMAKMIFGTGSVETNIVLADSPYETNYLKCIPVQLTTSNQACKTTRAALNLAKNDILQRKVRLQGDLDSYMGVLGLLKAHNHTLFEKDLDDHLIPKEEQSADEKEQSADNEGSNHNTTDEQPSTQPEESNTEDNGSTENTEDNENNEDTENTGKTENSENTNSDQGSDEWNSKDEDSSYEEDPILTEARAWLSAHGTEEAPLCVQDFKTTLATYYPAIDEAGYRIADIYVRGYIVGYYTSRNDVVHFTYNANKNYATNIVLADSPSETRKNNCIVIELPNNTTIRNELNLYNNKKNLGKRISIMGNIKSYKLGLGIGSPKKYTLD